MWLKSLDVEVQSRRLVLTCHSSQQGLELSSIFVDSGFALWNLHQPTLCLLCMDIGAKSVAKGLLKRRPISWRTVPISFVVAQIRLMGSASKEGGYKGHLLVRWTLYEHITLLSQWRPKIDVIRRSTCVGRWLFRSPLSRCKDLLLFNIWCRSCSKIWEWKCVFPALEPVMLLAVLCNRVAARFSTSLSWRNCGAIPIFWIRSSSTFSIVLWVPLDSCGDLPTTVFCGP